MLENANINVTRLYSGEPILSPTGNWWESGVTFNPAVIYLEPSEENAPIIENLVRTARIAKSELKQGVVVLHYRARPSTEADQRRPFARSCSGLAVFTPQLKLLHRYPEPVIMPDENQQHYDYVGVEDGRLHRFAGDFYYLYCGVSNSVNPAQSWSIKAQICLAKSKDLVNWQKLGPLAGNVNTELNNNKDGVFFPRKIGGYYYLLHRPCYDNNYSKYAIALARSETIDGSWDDLGVIQYANQDPCIAKHIWVGAGAVPIPLDDDRFLVIYHKGHILNSGEKWYDLHAAIFNFNNLDINNPGRIIEKQLDRILVPETPHERVAVHDDGVSNVVFTCGCYEYEDDLYIIYGGADCCTLAAKVNKQELLNAVEAQNHNYAGRE